MKSHRIVAMSLIAALGFGFAQAADVIATLSDMSGSVLVNQGREFVAAQPGAGLVPGDRVLARQGSEATLTFADGCKSSVAPGTMVTIPDMSPCKGGDLLVQSTNPGNSGALGVAGGAPDLSGAAIPLLAFFTTVTVGAILDNQRDTASP
ncbi:MAG TPA: hypothetical protein VFG55_01765 [Rhodanobacteraceae bacterium]|nr:hypothetical protein [Rhodanobacteraceae bacterium]